MTTLVEVKSDDNINAQGLGNESAFASASNRFRRRTLLYSQMNLAITAELVQQYILEAWISPEQNMWESRILTISTQLSWQWYNWPSLYSKKNRWIRKGPYLWQTISAQFRQSRHQNASRGNTSLKKSWTHLTESAQKRSIKLEPKPSGKQKR